MALAPNDLTTTERILDAAVAAAAVHGIARLSMNDVAREAGLSRPTLYKHFPSKDALVASAVARESKNVIDQVFLAASGHTDACDAIEAGVLAALTLTREHALLNRILSTEPETLLPLLMADGGPVLLFSREAVAGLIAVHLPELDEGRARSLAEIVSRLLVSYALNPPEDHPEHVAAAVASILVNGAFTPQESS